MTSVSGNVTFFCGHCRNELYKPFAWAVENDNFSCPVCTRPIRYDPKALLREDRAIRKAENEFARFVARMRSKM